MSLPILFAGKVLTEVFGLGGRDKGGKVVCLGSNAPVDSDKSRTPVSERTADSCRQCVKECFDNALKPRRILTSTNALFKPGWCLPTNP